MLVNHPCQSPMRRYPFVKRLASLLSAGTVPVAGAEAIAQGQSCRCKINPAVRFGSDKQTETESLEC